jgi:hypothetical protein
LIIPIKETITNKATIPHFIRLFPSSITFSSPDPRMILAKPQKKTSKLAPTTIGRRLVINPVNKQRVSAKVVGGKGTSAGHAAKTGTGKNIEKERTKITKKEESRIML